MEVGESKHLYIGSKVILLDQEKRVMKLNPFGNKLFLCFRIKHF